MIPVGIEIRTGIEIETGIEVEKPLAIEEGIMIQITVGEGEEGVLGDVDEVEGTGMIGGGVTLGV